MEIRIDKALLSKLQNGETGEELLSNASVSPSALKLDLMQGPGICYLLSGYRGAGKTTYINEVENLIKAEPDQRVAFVHVDFSRYREKGKLFRWLIRELYLAVSDLPGYKELKGEDRNKPLTDQTTRLLEELHEKTFKETTHTRLDSSQSVETNEAKFDAGKWVVLMVTAASALFCVLNLRWGWISRDMAVNVAFILVAAVTTVAGLYSITLSSTDKDTAQEDFSRKTLFDDEIADHHFVSLLRSFGAHGFNIIFVLDELDKLDDDQFTSVMIEIKPYMLSGHASFIAVAGQNLYYKYRQSLIEDDGMLSSIFSKTIHIGLLSRQGFFGLFNKLVPQIETPADANLALIDRYVDWLIFASKRIPRKFIHLIRDNIRWSEEGEAYLAIDPEARDLASYSRLVAIIGQVEDEQISVGFYEEAERDYFVMQLFICCTSILQNGRTNFEVDDFFLKFNGVKNADPGFPSNLDFSRRMYAFAKVYMAQLFARLENAKIIGRIVQGGSTYRLGHQLEVEKSVDIASVEQLDQKQLFDLKNLAISVCVQLSLLPQNEAGSRSFTELLRLLESHGAFNLPFLAKSEVTFALDKLADLVRGEEGVRSVSKILKEYSIDAGGLILQLLHFFSSRRADQVFGGTGYRATGLDTPAPYDYSLVAENLHYERILFQNVLRRGNPVSDRQFFLDRLHQLSDLDERTFLFLVVFTESPGMGVETIQLKFKEFLQEPGLPENLADRIQFVPVDIYDLKTIDNGFEEFIGKNIGRSFRHIFKQQPAPAGFHERNDDELKELFDFKKYSFNFRVTPDDTNFWRFGLRFLKESAFPPKNQGRHADSRIADIVVCVGTGGADASGLHSFQKPHELFLSTHHILPENRNAPNGLGYNKGPVEVALFPSADGSETTIFVKAGGPVSIHQVFNLKEYRYFLIAAWCEDTPFKLDTTIDITRKVD